MSNGSHDGLTVTGGTTWIAQNVFSGNLTGVNRTGGNVISYGDITLIATRPLQVDRSTPLRGNDNERREADWPV
jgi:hypothetical protein